MIYILVLPPPGAAPLSVPTANTHGIPFRCSDAARMDRHEPHPFSYGPAVKRVVAAPPAMAHKKRTRTYEDKDARYDSVRRRAACSPCCSRPPRSCSSPRNGLKTQTVSHLSKRRDWGVSTLLYVPVSTLRSRRALGAPRPGVARATRALPGHPGRYGAGANRANTQSKDHSLLSVLLQYIDHSLRHRRVRA